MEYPRVLNQKEFIELTLSNQAIAVPENVHFQRELFLTEYWRYFLFEIASEGQFQDSNMQPVHTRRIKRMLKQQMDAIWPELEVETLKDQTDVIKPVRNSLEKIGDIVRLRNGFYLPLPLRLIDLPKSKYSVIVGGMSTESIQNMLPSAKIAGYGRIIDKKRIPDSIKKDRHLWQEYANWIGWKPDNIDGWMTMQLRQLSTSGSKSIQGFEEFEVFNSFGNRESGSRSIWINQRTILAQQLSGVVLCKTVDSNRRYFLGELKDGCLLKELTITNIETLRWLMLGFRMCNGRPPIARWNNNFLKVSPQLPQAIECHMLVFSFKQNTYEYYVFEQLQDHVEQLLKSYGYQFLGKTRRSNDE